VHLHVIDITERIYGSVNIDGGREENLDSRRISRTHEASFDETRGEISEENTKKNQEQGTILKIFQFSQMLSKL